MFKFLEKLDLSVCGRSKNLLLKIQEFIASLMKRKQSTWSCKWDSRINVNSNSF